MQARTVYITCPDLASAQSIGKTLVQKRLAACANIMEGMQSIYWWEGKLAEDQEVVLLLKTMERCMDRLIETVKGLHPHKVPCIVSWLIMEANDDYLEWMEKETAL